MFHMQERQLLLSLLFKKPVHNAIRRFSCLKKQGDKYCFSYFSIKNIHLHGEIRKKIFSWIHLLSVAMVTQLLIRRVHIIHIIINRFLIYVQVQG